MLFQDQIGHLKVIQRLKQAVNQSKVSHAQLFVGPPGSGALPMSLAYAQYVLCHQKSAEDACGTCSSCVKMSKLIHPDVHFIFPVNTNEEVKKDPLSDKFLPLWRETLLENPYIDYPAWVRALEIENKQAIINTEDCSQILDKLSLKSYESGYKIMFIWMIEKLHHAAAPKLLKILEEPPEKTLFLVIAENTENILSTILSRLQQVKLERLSPEEVELGLRKKLGEESDALKIALAAKLSEGNFYQAIAYMKSAQVSWDEVFLKWMRWCFAIHKDQNIVALQDWTESFAKSSKEQIRSYLSYVLFVFSQCIKINQGMLDRVQLTDQQIASLSKLAPFIHTKNISMMEQEIEKAIYHLERNVNVKMILLDLSLKFSKLIREKEYE